MSFFKIWPLNMETQVQITQDAFHYQTLFWFRNYLELLFLNSKSYLNVCSQMYHLRYIISDVFPLSEFKNKALENKHFNTLKKWNKSKRKSNSMPIYGNSSTLIILTTTFVGCITMLLILMLMIIMRILTTHLWEWGLSHLSRLSRGEIYEFFQLIRVC